MTHFKLLVCGRGNRDSEQLNYLPVVKDCKVHFKKVHSLCSLYQMSIIKLSCYWHPTEAPISPYSRATLYNSCWSISVEYNTSFLFCFYLNIFISSFQMEYTVSSLSPCKLVSPLRARSSFWFFYSPEFWTCGRSSIRCGEEFCSRWSRTGPSFRDNHKHSKAACWEIPQGNLLNPKGKSFLYVCSPTGFATLFLQHLSISTCFFLSWAKFLYETYSPSKICIFSEYMLRPFDFQKTYKMLYFAKCLGGIHSHLRLIVWNTCLW